jgi:SAM-dependent methyltransferase
MHNIRSLEAPVESATLVSVLMDIIEEAAPLPGSHRQVIKHDILELWRELTSERSVRHADYIGEPAKFAAYLRYFLPWNVVRLIPILASLDLELQAGNRLLDIGSGPLTLPIALWIARPDLRSVPIQVVCVDRVKRITETGTTILAGLAMRSGLPLVWNIETRKATFPLQLQNDGTTERFSVIAAANVLNESFWKDKRTLTERANELAMHLADQLTPGGRILLVEPGDPRSGAMLAAIRESFILQGGKALAPCPHQAACPMAGVFLSAAFRRDPTDNTDKPLDRAAAIKASREAAARRHSPIPPVVTAHGRSKAPWCHFVLDRRAAPPRLEAFSESTGLPKDRLIASWLYAEPVPLTTPSARLSMAPASIPATTTVQTSHPLAESASTVNGDGIRIISDAFRLSEGGYARYACCRTGYTMVTADLARLPSGTLVNIDAPLPGARSGKDQKSGAVIIRAIFGPDQTRPDLPDPDTSVAKPHYHTRPPRNAEHSDDKSGSKPSGSSYSPRSRPANPGSTDTSSSTRPNSPRHTTRNDKKMGSVGKRPARSSRYNGLGSTRSPGKSSPKPPQKPGSRKSY